MIRSVFRPYEGEKLNCYWFSTGDENPEGSRHRQQSDPVVAERPG
jgi:hypothetical protein